MADGMALVARWMVAPAVCGWGLARPTWRQCSLETPAPEGASGGNGMVQWQSAGRRAGMRIPTELASISTLAIVWRPLSAGSERQSQKD